MVNETLIARCAKQESKAQYELYRALYGMMMGICSRYERNKQDAMDRMNQGFMKILLNLEQRRPEVPFEAWARRVMINTVIDGFRREKDRRAHEILVAPEEQPDSTTANEFLKHMEAEAFAGLLARVPPMSRNVFNLFAIDGFAHQEIATMLGISEGTSKWHVANARAILQQALAALHTNNERTVAQ
ncbi:MAG TPA: sigma-70 family RNA polymerase sigma factor [Flavobacteriales bacterium]|nr:sigma-70 family RNA polymerase sigma factor [Flavobacteriales bacterium]